MLQHDAAAALWYAILATAWTAYLAQESFIVGSGMLHRFGYGPAKRRSIQLSAGLHYDGIEVWLIVAIGGTFAAFPAVFAAILSSLYIPFFLLIASLIVRAISIEFMYKDDSPSWRSLMSELWALSSLLLPFLLGLYLANLFGGIAIDSSGYRGAVIELFGYAGLAGGLFFVAEALVAGQAWIELTTIEDRGEEKHGKVAPIAALLALFALILLFLALNNKTSLFSGSALYAKAPLLWALPACALIAGALAALAARRGAALPQFLAATTTTVLAMAALFAAAFPRMVIPSIEGGFGLDAFGSSSSQRTLSVMTWVAAAFIPIVVAYQAWKYLRFRKDRHEEARP
jgi:cytochrome bd ubiquinol oxidase subunit II